MTLNRARTGLVASALAAVLVSQAIAGCGGARKPEASASSKTEPPGTAFLQAATCSDWRRSGQAERKRTIRALTLAATKPDPENHGASLSDARAYRILQRACSTRASSSAVLYEIYNRAAAFQSVTGR